MNWDAVGAIGEIVGALAVVATLGYLASQIRQTRKATLAEIYQSRAHSRGTNSLLVALNSPDFHNLLFRFDASVRKLGPESAVAECSDEEVYLLRMYHQDIMVRMDNVHFQYQQGFITDAYLETVKRGLRRFVPIWKALRLDEQFPLTSAEFFESVAKDA